ncbi:type I restriction enzyme HsdR N-terminal domain-containing protein [Parasediminibacterium sp. JCM 36343]|uniref:type I restriction enzyme HsdR N-terminal domain-containing protein n=1 Tax=Parasediminibacterium sp. JCM 36343 TaxID=3374279 RepID=UPI003978AA09
MIKIEYPPYNFKIKAEKGKELIFDGARKRWVSLTPEEWVRQNFIQYLLQEIQYPASLIAIEKEIQLGELRKRCDIILYKKAIPWMIIECKEMNVPLTEKTVGQILHYHQAMPVPYLCLTNGNHVFIFEKTENSFREIKTFPV